MPSRRLPWVLALALTGGGALACQPARHAAPGPDAFVSDRAGLVSAESEERLEVLLAAQLEEVDVELQVVTVESLANRPLAELAGEIFERRRVGAASLSGRGLLLLVAADDERVRLAVSYEAEPLFPDAFVGYVEREQMVAYFERGLVGEGIEATVELIAARAYGETDVELERRVAVGRFRGGGAGAELPVPLDPTSDAVLPPPAASDELRDRFAAQPTPAAAWAAFVEIQRRRIKDPELGLYDEGAREILRRRPNSNAGQDHLARLYSAPTPTIRVQGDRAVVLFPEDPDHRLAPWFFRRHAAGWRLDGAASPRLVGYNHVNQWRFLTTDHPYAFAFEDFVLDRNGFAFHRGE